LWGYGGGDFGEVFAVVVHFLILLLNQVAALSIGFWAVLVARVISVMILRIVLRVWVVFCLGG